VICDLGRRRTVRASHSQMTAGRQVLNDSRRGKDVECITTAQCCTHSVPLGVICRREARIPESFDPPSFEEVGRIGLFAVL